MFHLTLFDAMKESNNKTTGRSQSKVSNKSTVAKTSRTSSSCSTGSSSRSGSHSNNPTGINQYTKK